MVLSVFLPTSQYLFHALELVFAFQVSGRTYFIPLLITMLDFILKTSSLWTPISQISFQTVLKIAASAGVPTDLMTGSYDNSFFHVVD